jgi:transcriptional regulator with XRE-family HTH domain
MATNEVPRGPISGYVVENVKRLRAERRWSLAELSDEMEKAGRPMLASGLHRLEQGKRRIDVDDVVALGIAFDKDPVTLLLPPKADGVVRLTVEREVSAELAWAWMRGNTSLGGDQRAADDVRRRLAVVEAQIAAIQRAGGELQPDGSVMFANFYNVPEQSGEGGDGEHQAPA